MPILDPYGSPSKFPKDGWFCKTCGAWVPDGVIHNCIGNKPGLGVQPDALAITINDILRRLQDAEDKIKILERRLNNEEPNESNGR